MELFPQTFRRFAFLSLGALHLASCETSSSVFQQPPATSPHAKLVLTSGVKLSFMAMPPAEPVSVLEINGKAPKLSGYDQSTVRLPPGPTHLFLRAQTGPNTDATVHLDFTADAGATYRVDHSTGVKDVAFMVTKDGRSVASAKSEKKFAAAAPASAPYYMPIIVPVH